MSVALLLLRRRMMALQSAPTPGGSGWVWATYSVSDITTATTLLYTTTGFASMEVDGVPETLATSYQFATTGDHIVRFKLSDVTAIPNNAFQSVSALTAVTFPDGLTTIGSLSFRSCTGLTALTFPSSLTTLNSSSFFYCSNVSGEVVVPYGVATIPDSCFRNCSGVSTFDIPSSVTSFAHFSFVNCKIRTLICRATTPPTWNESNTVSFASSRTIYVPYSADHSVLAAYQSATYWRAYASAMVELNQDGTIPS